MVLMLSAIIGVSTIIVFSAFSEAQLEQKSFVTHSGQVIQTSGDVLDPLYAASTVEFDPEKYLRDFNYGRISESKNGPTIRDFTILFIDSPPLILFLPRLLKEGVAANTY